MAKVHKDNDYPMSYKDIAEQLTLEEGIEYTEDQVRMIANGAMSKLSRLPDSKAAIDFFRDNED